MLPVNHEELKDIAIKLVEENTNCGSLFSKQKHDESNIINKKFLLDFVETLFKIFIHSKDFLQPHYFILDAYSLCVLENLIAEPSNVAEPIKVDDFELVLKDLHNLFLGEANKAEDYVWDFEKDFIYNVVFFYPKYF